MNIQAAPEKKYIFVLKENPNQTDQCKLYNKNFNYEISCGY